MTEETDVREESLIAHLERIREMTDVEEIRAEAVEAVIVNDGLRRVNRDAAAALNDVLGRRRDG